MQTAPLKPSRKPVASRSAPLVIGVLFLIGLMAVGALLLMSAANASAPRAAVITFPS